MNVQNRSEGAEVKNVVPLFSSIQVELPSDALTEMLAEGVVLDSVDETMIESSPRMVVRENQFPDQSMFVLDQQISGLKERLDRLKFYLADLDDLLPH
jgi:hypothetical protein